MRGRREVRRVGLDEQPVERDAVSASRRSRAFLKVTVPGEAEVVAALDALAGHRQVAGEAVQDGVLGRPLLLEDAQHVGVGVAVVDLQGLAEPLGEVDVPAEAVLLHGTPSGPVRK